MKTLLPILLLVLLPGVVVGQEVSPQPPLVLDCARTDREAGATLSSDRPRTTEGEGTQRVVSPNMANGEGSGVVSPSAAEDNATTLAVLLANRPERFTEEQWLRMMREPVNRALFPLRITQAMLDTLDARKLDLNYQYVLIPNEPENHGPRVR